MDCTACKRPVKTDKTNKLLHHNRTFTCNKMADGRAFTDYKPQCTLNKSASSSYDYRMYLIKNASKLIEENAKNVAKCNCFDLKEVGTMLPHQSETKCDEFSCYTDLKDINGLGVDRKYNNSNNH